jgi:hypothetical protein
VQNNCPPGPCAKLLNPLWFGAVHPGEEVLEALQSLRKRGLVISLAVAASTVRAVVSERCPDLLAENGGPVKVSHGWVSSWLYVNLRWTCHSSKLSVCAKLKIDPPYPCAKWKINSSDPCAKRKNAYKRAPCAMIRHDYGNHAQRARGVATSRRSWSGTPPTGPMPPTCRGKSELGTASSMLMPFTGERTGVREPRTELLEQQQQQLARRGSCGRCCTACGGCRSKRWRYILVGRAVQHQTDSQPASKLCRRGHERRAMTPACQW